MKKIILVLFALIWYQTKAQIPFQTGNDLVNRKVVLFQGFNNDHQFYGLGVNASTFRYQVDNTNSNHVFYAGATSSTSNELMRITGTGNVGIGISTPSAQLQLGNTAANRKIVLFDGFNNDHQYFGFGINASMLRYQVDGATSSHAFFSGASASTSTELMRIAGNGNVGIGISTPNAQLQLGNTAVNRKIVLFDGFNNDHQYFGFGINASMLRYQVDNSASVHAFFSGASASTSTELMRIAGTGNVGIGTNVPSEKLHVAGNVRIAGNIGIGNFTPNAPLQFENAVGNRKIVLYEATNNDHEYYGFGINGSMLRYQVDNSASVHAFFSATSASTSTELMRIAGNGNVGIGTNAPSEKLHVAGSVRIVDGTQGVGKVLTSDANGKATWTTSVGGGNTSELEKITEGGKTGWRILGRDPDKHGNIGSNAIDLSEVIFPSTTSGATGDNSFASGLATVASGQSSNAIGYSSIASGQTSTAMGEGTTASGETSTAMGEFTKASGRVSTTLGYETKAKQFGTTAIGFRSVASAIVSTAIGFDVRAKSMGEVAIGCYNDTLTVVDSVSFIGDNNRVFTVGIGSSIINRKTGFVIQQNGNVGVGTGAPTEKFHVVGNICYTGTIGACSDLRYKTNFSKIENPLNKVLALNGLHYDWKVEEFKENNFTKDRQIGFIAQEIEKIFPEMVQTDTKGYKSVDYGRLTPVLVEAIKELKTLNDELKNKNVELESNSQKIEARLNKIEALLYK